MQVFDHSKFRHFLKSYPEGVGEPTLKHNEGENGNLLKVLKWLRHYDEYYTVVDLRDSAIKWHYGVDIHLGYSKKDIDQEGIFFFRSIIHPFLREWHNLFTVTALQMIKNRTIEDLKIRKTRFVINIPVRKKNGNYVFVKQMLLPFQIDRKKNLVSFLNVYAIVDEYRGQPLRPRFFENLVRKEKWEKINKTEAAGAITLDDGENFTKTEFLVMDSFLFLSQLAIDFKGSDSAEVKWKKETQAKMDIKSPTFRTHKMNILNKIEILFLSPFENHEESHTSSTYKQCLLPLSEFESAVVFLQKCGILSVLKARLESTLSQKIGVSNF